MSRRKFNLGDILRKINEENSGNSPSAPPPPPRSPLPERRTDAPYVNPPARPALIKQQAIGQLPVQPDSTRRTQAEPGHTAPVKQPVPPPQPQGITSSPSPATAAPHQPVQPQTPQTNHHADMQQHEVAKLSGRPNAASSSDDDDDEEEFNIYKYIGILLRRKHLIFIIITAAAIISLFRYLKSDAYYIANARLLFRPDNEKIIDQASVFRYWGDQEKNFNTHLELLKSRSVLSAVAQNFGNKISPETINGIITIKQGTTNEEKNDIIELTCRYSNADTARDILNELCNTYIEYRRSVNSQEITRLVGKFEVQIGKLQSDLSRKESTLREFKENHRMVELTNETNQTISKLSDMETACQQTNLALLDCRERLTALSLQISSQEQEIVQSVTYQDPFNDRIAQLELELNTLTTEYSPEHFKVKMLRQQIDNLKAATVDSIARNAQSKTLVKNPIREALILQVVNLTVEKSALDAKRIAQELLIEKFSQALVRLPAMEQQYAFLQRETGSLLQTLGMLKTKYEETKIRRDSEESELKILEYARTPVSRFSTIKTTDIIIGIFIGLILGIALALIVEYLDQTLKDPSSVEKTLGTPLLGIVPFIEADNAILEHAADLTKNLLEPFRALRANLKHIAATHTLKTFIVCSAIKGEGKTTLAANLGITFALDGKKVILVDGDLRRSQVHSLFAIPKQTGLTDYLLGTASIDEIIKATRFNNMSVITSGERPHNPAELLGTPLFDRLIEELRSKADIIIFDSPALLPVSDTITMAPKMDGVLFVVRTFWTPLKAAKQALNQLQRIGSHLYGGILNGASHSGKYYPYYYGYYGYYGYYSYKYAYDEDHQRPFSIREAGLGIERSIRERLTSLRYALPKIVATSNRNLYRFAKKKTLWLLIVMLLAIVGSRMTIEKLNPRSTSGPIEYVGTGIGSATRSPHFETSERPANPVDAGMEMPPASTGQHVPVTGHKTLPMRLRAWFEAFALRQPDRYLSFYNKESFSFNGGGFEAWKNATGKAFDRGIDAAVIELDSTRTVKSDSLSATVLSYIRAMTAADTLRSCISTQWNLGADTIWYIIRQSTLSGGFGETEAQQ